MKLYQKFIHYYMENESGQLTAIPGFRDNLVPEEDAPKLLNAIIDSLKREDETKLECSRRVKLRTQLRYEEVLIIPKNQEFLSKRVEVTENLLNEKGTGD